MGASDMIGVDKIMPERMGYKNFIGFVLVFWKLHRRAIKYNATMAYTVFVPIGKKWDRKESENSVSDK